jgi:hypothetical protein
MLKFADAAAGYNRLAGTACPTDGHRYWEFTKMRLSQRPLKRQVREAIVVVVVGIAIVVTLVVVLKRVQVKLEAPPANPAAAR